MEKSFLGPAFFTHSFLDNVQEEFAVGDQKSQKIAEGRDPPDWDSLLEPCPFFQMFKNYLQVKILMFQHSPLSHP